MNNGKQKCELLKSLRKQIADEYNLRYCPVDCTHEGDCPGTCPLCDAEIEDLQRQLDALGVDSIDLKQCVITDVDNTATMLEDKDALLMRMPEPLPLPGIPYSPEYSQRNRVLLMDCIVAGAQYMPLGDINDLLYHRAPLRLVREEHSKYDEYAVAVHFKDEEDGRNYKIGYVPRSLGRVIAIIMDAGWSNIFEAEVDGFKMCANKDKNIHMSIYVFQNDI